MDIATHAIMGGIVASPFLAAAPLPAAGFALGSTLPDLDAFSRIFGKRAFLAWHQTYSHSLPLICALTFTGWWFTRSYGDDISLAIAATGAGMALHALLDLTNTYGVKLLFPLSRRRFCLEWIFFIDAGTIAINLLFLAWILSSWPEPPPVLAFCYMTILAVYVLARAVLRVWASTLSSPDTLSLIPSALWPGVFLGCRRSEDEIITTRLNVLSGDTAELERLMILDRKYELSLARISEWNSMRQLSPAYHVVEAVVQGETSSLACRDLRITNFKTRFGQLELVLDTEGNVIDKTFHV